MSPEIPGAHALKFTNEERVSAVANAGSPSDFSQRSRFLRVNQKDRRPLTTRLDRKRID